MNPELEERCNTIKKLLEKWIPRLGLTDWHITVQRDDEPPCEDEGHVLMQVWSDWRYRDITITIMDATIMDADEDRLEEYVLHELCHVLVSELRPNKRTEAYRDKEERTVTVLARCFVRSQDALTDVYVRKVEELLKAADAAIAGKPAALNRLRKQLS